MQLGVVGLGRMGANIVRRLQRGGHACVGYDRDAKAGQALTADGARAAGSLKELVEALAPPRAVWIMLPAGAPTEQAIDQLAGMLASGDCVIDGGNTHFKDDIARAARLKPRGIGYLDVGTSGGVWGLDRGYCLMIGGDEPTVRRLDPLFSTLAPGTGEVPPSAGRKGLDTRPERGYVHCGPVGAGHFVKMVHNGIEYGMMQAFAEGFDIMRGASGAKLPEAQRYNLDLADIAEAWRRGSVVSSWLLDLTADALAESPTLSNYTGRVPDSGEGRWTIEAAIEEEVAADVLASSLFRRFRSRQEQSFAEKLLSAMRHKFGGHSEA
jgi:6-phosphogluconate dehydrogenase